MLLKIRNMVMIFRIVAIFFFLSGAIDANCQTVILTENERRQVVKNLEAILTGGKNGFQSLKTNVKSAAKNVDSSFQARLAILPAKTKTASHIYYYKKFIYYFEETEADIYTITQALRPLLSSDDFTEIYPEEQGTYTFTARAFASSNLVIEISYKTEKEKKYSTIMIVKKDEYSSKPLKPLANNWETEKKGFGFSYRANGKDSVVVTEVFANSPAAAAGLKTGDLINTINKAGTKDKALLEVAKMISNTEGKAELGLLRNGKNQAIIIQKDWRYKYDKTCLSGDCVNGKGIAMSKVTSGLLMEGKFSDGQLVDGDWYLNAKSAQEKGSLIRRGKILFDRFFTGYVFDGSKPEGGWWYNVNNHDIVKTSVINEKTLNGYVRCYTNKNKRYLWEGEFTNGKKSGEFYEYLHDKGFFWSYYIMGNEKMFHKLKKLVDGLPVGEWLNDDALNYNETTKTWSGGFNTNLVNSKLDSYWPLYDIARYDDIEPKAWAARNVTNSGNNSGNNNATNTKPSVKPSAPAVKYCSHCNGMGKTYTYVCSNCNNTGWSNTYIGPNSYSLVRQICTCVGAGMMGYTYIQKTLESRKKICGYCNGKGVFK
jgi:uncharacterized membrane protein